MSVTFYQLVMGTRNQTAYVCDYQLPSRALRCPQVAHSVTEKWLELSFQFEQKGLLSSSEASWYI